MGKMSEKLSGLISKLDHLTIEQQEKDLLEIVRDHSREIIDLNQSQLLHGQDANGKSLGQYHNEAYAAYKRILNPLGVVDLKLTGSFYDHMFVRANSWPVTIDSTDSKRDMLIQGDAYGEDAFGLQEENKSKLAKGPLKEAAKGYYRRQIL